MSDRKKRILMIAESHNLSSGFGRYTIEILQRLYDSNKYEIAELIVKNRPELTDENVKFFLKYAPNKEKIAEILQKETDNISKLTHDNVLGLFSSYFKNNNFLRKVI